MIAAYIERAVKNFPGVEGVATPLARSIHTAVLNAGEPARTATDFLHGTWLGHPLHPVLTDIPIGAWSLAMLFDGLAAASESEDAERTAHALTTVGVIAAVPTAIAGVADYSTIPKNAAPMGFVHAMLNSVALMLYILSIRERQNKRRGTALFFSTTAFLILVFSAWLGGELVYKQRVGVNHGHPSAKPQQWKAVLPQDELQEHEAKRVEVEGNPVLLYRYGGTVYAIGAVCSHAGGPLEKGQFDGFCVQCPWHDSVFDVRDGGIVHGPSTYRQPKYRARMKDGQIEVQFQRAV